jgi:hypothetical protein
MYKIYVFAITIKVIVVTQVEMLARRKKFDDNLLALYNSNLKKYN